MAINLALASITAAGATETRNLGERFSDVLNVKDFGAVGDNSANDTQAIQACLDAAFGSYSAPHGGIPYNGALNKTVYFPNGTYKVSPPGGVTARAITAAAEVGGDIRITTATTTPLVNGDMVYIRGVVGTTFANGSYQVANVTATTFTLVNSQYNGAYVSGGTWCPPCLKVRDVYGGRLIGTGMGSCGLLTEVDGCAVISTNGMTQSHIEGIYFAAGDNGIGFDLNLGTPITINLQSNTFTKCGFGGGASTRADYGCTVGFGQNMGSENTWFWCNFGGCDVAGLYIHNQNSLDNTVFGGNIASNKCGILVNSGSCPWIHGISFQNYQDNGLQDWWDIRIINSQKDAYSISGCRTESYKFLYAPVDATECCIHISGCSHLGGIDVDDKVIFYQGNADTTIDGCRADGGYVGGDGKLTIFNADGFKNPDFLTQDPVGHNYRYLEVHPQRIVPITASRSMISPDGSAKLQFNSASPITYTVLRNSDGYCRLGAGTYIDLQRMSASAAVTVAAQSGVNLCSRGTLRTLNGQYATARLVCDGTDTWSLYGDLV